MVHSLDLGALNISIVKLDETFSSNIYQRVRFVKFEREMEKGELKFWKWLISTKYCNDRWWRKRRRIDSSNELPLSVPKIVAFLELIDSVI
jgi:hypothetical protein